jgi:hypothetical protein
VPVGREHLGWIIGLILGAATWLIADDLTSAIALFIIFVVAIPTALRSKNRKTTDEASPPGENGSR